eukprot:scaffold15215_cov103-Isochrysis_galbana.AAC.10
MTCPIHTQTDGVQLRDEVQVAVIVHHHDVGRHEGQVARDDDGLELDEHLRASRKEGGVGERGV